MVDVSPNEPERVTPSTPEGSAPVPPMQRAQDALMREVAGESSVKPLDEADVLGEKTGEDDFIHFVEQESTKIPEERPEKAVRAEQSEEKREQHGIVRTYESDVVETIREQKLSMTKIAIAEASRGVPSTPDEEAHLSTRQIIVTTGSVVLIIAGLSLVGFLFARYRSLPVITAPPIESLVLASREVRLDITDATRDSVLLALSALRATEFPSNEIVNVSLSTASTTRAADAHELLATLKTSVDAALLRSVDGPFMLGIQTFGTPRFFLVLKTTFFENAFAGMLRWERQMPRDLPLLVREPPPLVLPEIGTSSPTSTVFLTPPALGAFEDTVIDNRDARGRRAYDGQYDIIYAFADPETLVIAPDVATLRTVLERINVSRFGE